VLVAGTVFAAWRPQIYPKYFAVSVESVVKRGAPSRIG
jgi:hypothetical protein